MIEPREQIRRALGRFARRERWVLGIAAGSAFVGVVALGWLIGVAMLNLGMAPPGLLAVGAVLSLACGAAFWWLRALPQAGELRRQALRVEALRPAIAGELLTVLDRAARPMGSEALVERMARRALVPVESIPGAEVVPSRDAARLLALAALAGMALLLSNALDIGPGAVWSALRAVSPVRAPPVTQLGPRAVVGDITLRYLYPTYTGLSPLEVPNSNGEVHAPPGTRVEVAARTEKSWDDAVLEAYGQDLPVETSEDRGLRSGFVLPAPLAGAGPESVWRFRFTGAAGSMLSPDFRIVIDPDLAPQVTVDAPRNRQSVKVNAPLGIPWHVHDDYGITTIVIEVTEGGSAREVALRSPINAPRDLDDRLTVTPKDLGLRPGAVAEIRLKAMDNDEISGSKAGRSSVIQLEVEGASGDQARLLPRRKELRDALILVLAEFLVEPQPAVDDPAEGVAWVKAANLRYEAYDNLVAAHWSGGQGLDADQLALDEVAAKRRVLFALLGALPAADRLASGDAEAIVAVQAAHIQAVEGAVLLFDEILQRFALLQVSEIARQLADEATEMNRDFATVDADNAAGAQARLDQLRRLLRDLQAAAAQMGDTSLRQFTNDSADRLSDMLAEAQKALAEGRFDDAKAMMDRIAEQMRQLADGLEDQQKRQAEQSSALEDAMKDLDKQLEALEADQQKLREQTEQAQEEHGASMDEALAVWKEIEERAQSAAAGSAEVTAAAGPLGGGVFRSAGDLRSEADGLLDAARSRNAERTRSRAESTLAEASSMSSVLTWSARQRQAAPGFAELAASVAPIQADAERILKLLEKLADQQASPQLQQALQQLAQKQQAISDRAEELAGKAKAVARSLPMKAPGLEQGTRQASAESGRAAEAMKGGDPMSAAGGQRAAEDGIREARDALKQASETMQSMAAGGKPGEEGDKGGEGGKRSGPGSMEMPIPTPEEFQTPEEYRRALMEGMQGTVPEQYRSTNLRYYEELVRQ